MSEMCHLYSVSCHIVYIVKSYSKSFSFHHLSQKHTKKIEKNEKMLLRIHPPNQGYLKAHSLYSNHFFRLVCSIAITTQKKNHIIECTLPLHVIYFSLQTVHSLAVSGWRDYVWLWCATMAQSYSTYPRSKHNKKGGGGSRRLLMKPSGLRGSLPI